MDPAIRERRNAATEAKIRADRAFVAAEFDYRYAAEKLKEAEGGSGGDNDEEEAAPAEQEEDEEKPVKKRSSKTPTPTVEDKPRPKRPKPVPPFDFVCPGNVFFDKGVAPCTGEKPAPFGTQIRHKGKLHWTCKPCRGAFTAAKNAAAAKEGKPEQGEENAPEEQQPEEAQAEEPKKKKPRTKKVMTTQTKLKTVSVAPPTSAPVLLVVPDAEDDEEDNQVGMVVDE